LLGSGVDNHNASNNPIAAAGNRILFVAQHDQTGDNIFFGAEASSSSIEIIKVDGNTFKKNATEAYPSSVQEGAWFTSSNQLFFTDGTTSGTYKASGEEMVLPEGKIGIVNDRPWFVADYDWMRKTMGIWRALPLSEWTPISPMLLDPAENDDGTTVNPTFLWKKSANTEHYQLQVAEQNSFSDLVFDNSLITDTTFTLTDSLAFTTVYYWRAKAINSGGESDWSSIWSFSISTAVSTESKNIPVEFTLQQNYPNPFNPTTQIRYGIKEAVDVRLVVYNMLGQEVITLVNEKKSAGWHTITLDASGFSSGFYIYRIQAGDFVDTKKLMLIK